MFRILVSIITNKYHSHSRYADKDEFEMLQNKIRTLERFFNSHQYNSNTHQLMLRKVFALFF